MMQLSLNNMENLENKCTYGKVSEDLKIQLESYQSIAKSMLDSLVNCHKRCLTLSDPFYSENHFRFEAGDPDLSALNEEMSYIINRRISDARINQGYKIKWTLDNVCMANAGTNLKLTGMLFEEGDYSAYNIVPLIEVYVNGQSLGRYNYNIKGKTNINFKSEIPFDLDGDKIEFEISFISGTATDASGENYELKALPMSDMHLQITH